ncbi:hypothetical protein KEM55_000387, partial [Ascosphaera atra]
PGRVCLDTVWWTTGTAIRVAQQIGLHREGTPGMGFDAVTGERRESILLPPASATAVDYHRAKRLRGSSDVGSSQHQRRQHVSALESPGLKRRIWWTLYARERYTALCEGKPCIIDLADCDVREPTPADFPETVDYLKVQTWLAWVRLSGIVGRIARFRARACREREVRFPGNLARELIDWVRGLPEGLALHVSGERNIAGAAAGAGAEGSVAATQPNTPGGDAQMGNTGSATTSGTPGAAATLAPTFNRDTHQLYLPYLSAITLLYLTPSSQPLAKSYTTAILSAACVARIFEDYLARRSVRFLQGLAGWHIAIAIIALLHGRRIRQLTEQCDRNIALLRIALKEIGRSWPSARLFASILVHPVIYCFALLVRL